MPSIWLLFASPKTSKMHAISGGKVAKWIVAARAPSRPFLAAAHHRRTGHPFPPSIHNGRPSHRALPPATPARHSTPPPAPFVPAHRSVPPAFHSLSCYNASMPRFVVHTASLDPASHTFRFRRRFVSAARRLVPPAPPSLYPVHGTFRGARCLASVPVPPCRYAAMRAHASVVPPCRHPLRHLPFRSGSFLKNTITRSAQFSQVPPGNFRSRLVLDPLHSTTN
ncbi:hypothetical protein DFH06DRAFT_1343944 [Mycena polygramma]|nr:hypothetical protein DFH06DRAFT_1343944 [Mycena polygramma]